MQRLPANFRFQICLFVGAFVHTIRCAAFVCRFYAVNCNVCRAFFHSDSDDKTSCFRQFFIEICFKGLSCVLRWQSAFSDKKVEADGNSIKLFNPCFPVHLMLHFCPSFAAAKLAADGNVVKTVKLRSPVRLA